MSEVLIKQLYDFAPTIVYLRLISSNSKAYGVPFHASPSSGMVLRNTLHSGKRAILPRGRIANPRMNWGLLISSKSASVGRFQALKCQIGGSDKTTLAQLTGIDRGTFSALASLGRFEVVSSSKKNLPLGRVSAAVGFLLGIKYVEAPAEHPFAAMPCHATPTPDWALSVDKLRRSETSPPLPILLRGSTWLSGKNLVLLSLVFSHPIGINGS